MFYLRSFSVIWGFAGVVEAWPYQQTPDGPNITSEHRRDLQGNSYVGPTESFKPTPSKYYECHGTDICETGVHFCSERRRACEKCADYESACGTNFQNPNCTHYCMKILIQEFLAEGKCNETVSTKSSLITTEKALDYRQKTNSSAPTDNLETCSYLMWICVCLGIVLAASLSCNVYQYCCCKRSKQMEPTEQDQTGLLLKDRHTDSLVDTPSSSDFISKQYTSACSKEDESGRRSLMPSAASISKEKLDQNETSVKSHEKHLPIRDIQKEEPNQGREHQAGPRDTMDELRGLEDADKQSSSGYSSASSTKSLNSSDVTNNTTNNFSVNINIHNGQTGLSTTSTETKKNAIQPENPRKEVPFGVEETDAEFNHGKLVSDEDQNGRLALLEISADIDFKKASPNG